MPNRQVTQAIIRLVDYNWADEERDFNTTALEPGNSRNGHIFTDLMLIREWLEKYHGAAPVEPRANPAPAPSVFTALLDSPGRNSGHIGVFSTEERARTACQEHKDEDDEVSGMPKGELAWKDDSAEVADGDKYVVILTTLDVPTGQG